MAHFFSQTKHEQAEKFFKKLISQTDKKNYKQQKIGVYFFYFFSQFFKKKGKNFENKRY